MDAEDVAVTELDIEEAEATPLQPWIPTLKYRFVRITPTSITGRAFRPRSEPEHF